jgi:hypothetical protein
MMLRESSQVKSAEKLMTPASTTNVRAGDALNLPRAVPACRHTGLAAFRPSAER